MAYRTSDRLQNMLFPPCLEDYVKREDPVRVYDAFVNALDLEKLGIEINPTKVGNSTYDPRAMLKLLVYGYSYGVRSSRKLERELHHNLSFIWLMGGLEPDHKTIAQFRRYNLSALKNVLKQCARMCIEWDLIEGNSLFVDGSKFRANAGIKQTVSRKHCQKLLGETEIHIEKILTQCEATDIEEENQGSLVKVKEELTEKNNLKEKLQALLKQMDAQEIDKINGTDPECRNMKGIQGTHAAYNIQNVVDEAHGLIVTTDVVQDGNDLKQLSNQIEQAQDVLEKTPQSACADSGYSDPDELQDLDQQGIKVIVPSARQAAKETSEPEPFDKEHFHYEKENDSYLCPEGHRLTYYRRQKKKKSREYKISDASVCLQCSHFGVCTRSKGGRTLARLDHEQTREKFEQIYQTPESQETYRLRKQKVELPFGHIKRNLKMDAFLVRGTEGAKAEMALLSSCFNIARMIILFGIPTLLEKLTS